MAALGAIHAREPVMRITTFEKTLDDALFEQPLQAPFGAQFGQVAIGALVKRTRARLARAINTTCWRASRRSLAAS